MPVIYLKKKTSKVKDNFLPENDHFRVVNNSRKWKVKCLVIGKQQLVMHCREYLFTTLILDAVWHHRKYLQYQCS